MQSQPPSTDALDARRRRASAASKQLAMVVSGGSGTMLAVRFATAALVDADVAALHVVVTGPASKVLGHELGPEWASARGFCDRLPVPDALRDRLHSYPDTELTAAIASGSHPLAGVVVLPCSAGMAGALAHGISRGLAQRVADVAIKQRWPLVLGIRETPMSPILLENLLRLANTGAYVVPPVPAFYLRRDETTALAAFADHYCMRVLDLLGMPSADAGLRWGE
jgi:4-hydroxy-3-polyprenylbenzoate decarboxylase